MIKRALFGALVFSGFSVFAANSSAPVDTRLAPQSGVSQSQIKFPQARTSHGVMNNPDVGSKAGSNARLKRKLTGKKGEHYYSKAQLSDSKVNVVGSKASSDQTFSKQALVGKHGQKYYTKKQIDNSRVDSVGSKSSSDQLFGDKHQ